MKINLLVLMSRCRISYSYQCRTFDQPLNFCEGWSDLFWDWAIIWGWAIIPRSSIQMPKTTQSRSISIDLFGMWELRSALIKLVWYLMNFWGVINLLYEMFVSLIFTYWMTLFSTLYLLFFFFLGSVMPILIRLQTITTWAAKWQVPFPHLIHM